MNSSWMYRCCVSKSAAQAKAGKFNLPIVARANRWKLGHDAIRYDLDAIMSALETANATLVVRGRALPGWQVEALRSTVRSFYLGLHMHLAHKRTVLFPMLSARLVLPSKMLDYDEATLMALLDRVRGLCEGLDITASPTAKAAVRELYAGFFVLRTLLRQQMEREEVLGLPLLRMHFTAREAAAAERKLISQMRPADLAWLLRPLAEAEKKETLTRVGVPGLFQKLVLLPALRRADRAVLRTHRELASGEKLGRVGSGLWRDGDRFGNVGGGIQSQAQPRAAKAQVQALDQALPCAALEIKWRRRRPGHLD
ncbi:hypothetical protein VOLCADRAFT_121522 [Volvox carteri f. nagariensis]|uniref:Hemerythrin-like domain-containing protein n=1 Tax=Volvox carteri f. nagariensis TaxID=3068 RepID=D8UCL9_VOLCA|nr:uncharacterized protein VOLCADRAFT_121522 [Volvox carteri f. nagariensis]EFJ42515.1 hypothetical protein VOLCADRAFT_121522 [Volvox carteri f. nagariensis]|eukprot:XP_002956371.1 hypothetical protein VOLCADRAFT_121522 [Volvox carteri f. nagariensis]